MDTMLLMGLRDLYEQAVPFVASLTFDDVSVLGRTTSLQPLTLYS